MKFPNILAIIVVAVIPRCSELCPSANGLIVYDWCDDARNDAFRLEHRRQYLKYIAVNLAFGGTLVPL